MLLDKLKELGLDTSLIGLELGEGQEYSCTPKGAEIFAQAGVDGIHYCFVEGFGEMVFAVSPMNGPGEYVHPLARNFADFLRLILACGDAGILEQLWGWDREGYEALCRENPPTPEQRAVLDAIAQELDLSPMEDPFVYVKELQNEFDPSRLTFRQEYWDSLPSQPEPPEWKVCFEGGFWGGGRGRAGMEIPIQKWFDWAGETWYVPAAYSCGRGLVIDFCVRVEPERIRAFLDKWDLNPEHGWREFTPDQELQIRVENPLTARFHPRVLLNSRELRQSHGCAVTWNPCLPDGEDCELEAKWVLEHYGLDGSYGWIIHRGSFPWGSARRPKIRTLSVTLAQELTPLPGPHFHVSGPGDQVELVHPGTGEVCQLTVLEYQQQEMKQSGLDKYLGLRAYELSTHYIRMAYTLSPEPVQGRCQILDCARSDPPRSQGSPRGEQAASVGIIGGADGPIAIFGGNKEDLRIACSALHFEPVEDVEWQVVFYEKKREDITLDLI